MEVAYALPFRDFLKPLSPNEDGSKVSLVFRVNGSECHCRQCFDSSQASLARVLFRPLTTRVTVDVTTPVELASALPRFGVLVGVVPPPAAHQVTTTGT